MKLAKCCFFIVYFLFVFQTKAQIRITDTIIGEVCITIENSKIYKTIDSTSRQFVFIDKNFPSKIILRGGFINKKPYGKWYSYYKSGIIHSFTHYQGLHMSKWIWWYPSGQIMCKYTSKDGIILRNRNMRFYDENGQRITWDEYMNLELFHYRNL